MKRTKQVQKILWMIALIVCVAVFIYSLFRLIPPLLDYRAAGSEYQSLAEIAYVPEDTQPGAGKGGYVSPIDFTALMAINPGIVGWIVVDGTDIDYPIVRGMDNDVYLHTTFSGEENASGAIFMDYRCTPDFSDRNTIVYGHMMKNDTMFAGLTKYKDQDFYEQHPSFTLYTPDAVYTCDVFSAYVTPSDSSTYTLDYKGNAGFGVYLDEVASRSMIQAGGRPESEESVITLSTCDYTYEDARMVVHAKISCVNMS